MQDFSYGIQEIWDKFGDFETECISGIVENIRHVEDTQIHKMQADYLKKIGAFYVPDGEFLVSVFGESITDPRTGLFSAFNTCFLQDRLAIPLRFANGTVGGFVGYANKPKNWPEDTAFIKYGYPPKVAFNKGRYFFIEPEEIQKAIDDEYICIVDGLFDKMILQCLGINAVSLCGSALTDWHKYYLSFIKHKIVIADNDQAGRKLFNICRWKLSGVVELRQPYTGDIDDYLKTQGRIEEFLRVFNEMKSEGFILSKQIHEPKAKEHKTHEFTKGIV